MDTDDRHAVLDRAETLLPKYGGLVEGAVNQALLLLGIRADADTHRSLVAELTVREAAAQPCPKGDDCALNSGAVHCLGCGRNWPPDETWEPCECGQTHHGNCPRDGHCRAAVAQ